MKEERIGPDNFMKIFTSTLERLSERAEDCCPAKEFNHVAMYMLGIASSLGFVALDYTVSDETYLRLTPRGRRWLEERTPLDQMKARAPMIIEEEARA